MYSIRATALSGPPKKRQRLEVKEPSPITIGCVETRLSNKNPKERRIKILLDSGSSGTLINDTVVSKLRNRAEAETQWKTAAGTFTTKGKCKIRFRLPEFYEHRSVDWKVHVTAKQMGYDMIIGRDLLHELGMNYPATLALYDNPLFRHKPSP